MATQASKKGASETEVKPNGADPHIANTKAMGTQSGPTEANIEAPPCAKQSDADELWTRLASFRLVPHEPRPNTSFTY